MLGSIPHQNFYFYHLPTRGRAGIKLGDAWYVSNVSIIFDCSMLFYYLFWMITGFIIHFYITFGTNLLTGDRAHIVVLLLVSVFRRKGISNGVQTEWNLRESHFWNERDPEDLECKSRSIRGSHEGGGRAQRGWARPPISWPPRLLLGLHSKSSGSRSFQKSRSQRFHSFWIPFDIPFLRNTEIGKKQQFALGLWLVG